MKSFLKLIPLAGLLCVTLAPPAAEAQSVPDAPTHLEGSVVVLPGRDTVIQLEWPTPVSGTAPITHYTLEYTPVGSGGTTGTNTLNPAEGFRHPNSFVVNGNGTTVTRHRYQQDGMGNNNGISGDVTIRYRLRANSAVGGGAWSQPVEVSVRHPNPAPVNLTGTLVTLSSVGYNAIELKWPTPSGASITGYRLEFKVNGGAPETILLNPGEAQSLNAFEANSDGTTVTNHRYRFDAMNRYISLTGGTFSYRLQARNVAGFSDYSLPFEITLDGPTFAYITSYASTNILNSTDPSAFVTVRYRGIGIRRSYERYTGGGRQTPFHLYSAKFEHMGELEIQVEPSFGDSAAGMQQAIRFAKVLGQMPPTLIPAMAMFDVQVVQSDAASGFYVVRKGFSHTATIVISSGVAGGIGTNLEESLLHEMVHATVGSKYGRDSSDAWENARNRDARHISYYAKRNRVEDFAVSFVLYWGWKYKRDRIPSRTVEIIVASMPNRIAYFDSLGLDLRPPTAATTSPPPTMGTVPTFAEGVTIPEFRLVEGLIFTQQPTLPTATGGDGELTYSLLVPRTSTGLHVSTYDNRTLLGRPWSGSLKAVWTVRDSDGDAASLIFTITVYALPDTAPFFPVGTTIANVTMTAGTLKRLTLPETAIGGNRRLTYQLTLGTPNPTGLFVHGYQLFGVPTVGSVEATWTVRDTDDNTDPSDTNSLTFTITVVGICDLALRTPPMSNEILSSIPDISNCAEVTPAHLAAIPGIRFNSDEASNVHSFRGDDFDGMTSAAYLEVDGGNLKDLYPNIFQELTALATLDLRNNKLNNISNNVFNQIGGTLTKLFIQDNELVLAELPDGVFGGLTGLLPDGEGFRAGQDGGPLLPKLRFALRPGQTLIEGVEVVMDVSVRVGVPVKLRYRWTATAPAGATLSQSSGLVDVPLGTGAESVPFTFRVDDGASSGGISGVTVSLAIDESGTETNTLGGWRYQPPEIATITLPEFADDDVGEVNICGHTPEVLAEILRLTDSTDCATVRSARINTVSALTLDIGLTSLAAGDFAGLPGLTSLTVINNSGLTALPADVFSGLSALTTLNLFNNGLTALQPRQFAGLSALRTLNLNSNALSYAGVPDRIFDGLSSLQPGKGVGGNLTGFGIVNNTINPRFTPDFTLTRVTAGAPNTLLEGQPVTYEVGSRWGFPAALTVIWIARDANGGAEQGGHSNGNMVIPIGATAGTADAQFSFTPNNDNQQDAVVRVLLLVASQEPSADDGWRYGRLRPTFVSLPGEIFADDDTPADTAPPAFADGATIPDLTMNAGTLVQPQSLPTASGGDGDLTYTLTLAAGQTTGLTVAAAGGMLAGTPSGGTVLATWTVTDSDGNTAAADTAILTFTITVISPDTAPTFANGATIPVLALTAGATIIQPTLPHASGDNGTLIYALTLTDAGTTGLSVNTGTGTDPDTLVGTPTVGTATAVWTVSDSDTNTDPADTASLGFTITVYPVGDAPIFGSATIPNLTLIADTLAQPPVPTAGGGDGELTYTLTLGTPNTTGLSVADGGRTLTGTPRFGSVEATWTVHDSDNNRAAADADTLTFTISVADICDLALRTPPMSNKILSSIYGISNCAEVTLAHLASIPGIRFNFRVVENVYNFGSDDFDGMTSATYLEVDGGNLKDLYPNIFQELTALATLDLRNNKLNNISSNVFNQIGGTLTKLFIQDNELVLAELPDGVFAGLTGLLPNGEGFQAGQDSGPLLPKLRFALRPGQTLIEGVEVVMDVSVRVGVPVKLRYRWTATAPAGATLSQSSGLVDVPLGTGAESVPFTFRVDDGASSGGISGVTVSLAIDESGTETNTLGGWRYQPPDIATITLPEFADDDVGEVNICGRTSKVLAEILRLTDSTDCATVRSARINTLSALTLDNVGLTSLAAGDFAGLPGLTSLTIINNSGLTALPADVFSGLSMLTTLNLFNNGLTELQPRQFAGLSALRTLNLNSNALSYAGVPDRIFDGLSSLQPGNGLDGNLTGFGIGNNAESLFLPELTLTRVTAGAPNTLMEGQPVTYEVGSRRGFPAALTVRWSATDANGGAAQGGDPGGDMVIPIGATAGTADAQFRFTPNNDDTQDAVVTVSIEIVSQETSAVDGWRYGSIGPSVPVLLTAETFADDEEPADTAPAFADGATIPDFNMVAGTLAQPPSPPTASGGNGTLTYTLTLAAGHTTGLTVAAGGRTLVGTPSVGSVEATWTVHDSDGNTDPTDTASLTFTITVNPVLPGAPTGLDANANGAEITLTWTAPVETGGASLSGYKVEIAEGSGGNFVEETATPTATTYTHNGSASTTYRYRVRATNSAGDGGYSNVATVTTEDMLALMKPADKTYTAGREPRGDDITALGRNLPAASGGSGTYTYTLTVTGGTLPTGLNITGGGGTSTVPSLTGTPSAATTAAVTLTYRVTDGTSAPAVAWMFTVTVTAPPIDTAPTFADGATIPALTMTAGTLAQPPSLPDATGGNGTLTYALTLAAGHATGLGVGTDGRTLTGTPTANGTTATAVPATWTVTDSDTNTDSTDADTLTFIITVIPDTAPAFAESATIPDLTLIAGRNLVQPVLPKSATGGNGGLTYTLTLVAGTTGLSVDTGTDPHTLTGAPTAGTAMATWTATDSDSDTATLTFVITVPDPSSATKLALSHGDLLNGGLTGFTELKSVTLNTGDITTLAAGTMFNEAAPVAQLEIKDTAITNLPTTLLSGVKDTLTSIKVTGNNELTELPEGFFEGMAGAVTLDFSGNNNGNPLPLKVAVKEKTGSPGVFYAAVKEGTPVDLSVTLNVLVEAADTATLGGGGGTGVSPAALGVGGGSAVALQLMGKVVTIPAGGTRTRTTDNFRPVSGTAAPLSIAVSPAQSAIATPGLVFVAEITPAEQNQAASAAVLPQAAAVIANHAISAIAGRVAQANAGGGGGGVASFGGQSSLGGVLTAHGQAMTNGTRSIKDLLGNSNFVLPLFGDAGGDSKLTFWGGGDYRSLRGHDAGLNWDGNVFSALFGIDTMVADGVLGGVALSWNKGDFGFSSDAAIAGNGDYTLNMTSVHPYLGWSALDGRLDLWASAGVGSGSVDITRTGATGGSGNATLQALAIGGSGPLLEEHDLRLKIEATQSTVSVDGGLPALSATAGRLRVAVEHNRMRELPNGAHSEPKLEAALRHDNGDGQTGTGVELAASYRRTNATGTTIEAGARVLVGRDNYEEFGVHGLLRIVPASNSGRGLGLSLRPTYGQTTKRTGELWNGAIPTNGTPTPTPTLTTNIHYTLPTRNHLLTPYTEMTLNDNTAAYRLGIRWSNGPLLNLHIHSTPGVNNTITLKGRLRF